MTSPHPPAGGTRRTGAVAAGPDQTRTLQAAIDRAAASGEAVVLSGRYLISGTLSVPSGVSITGESAVIVQTRDNTPVLASNTFLGRAELRGRTRLAGLRLEGTGRGERQDGIVLYDFWSEIADVEVVGMGGRGIALVSADRNGERVTSTLVENRVRRSIVRECAGTAFFLGEPANGKLTDGEISDCIAQGRDGSSAPLVAVGHAAGWSIRGVHTYGGRPQVAIEVRQGYFTRIADIYCEGFGLHGLAFPQVQTQVSVASAQIIAQAVGPGAAFLATSAHRDFSAPHVSLSDVSLSYFGNEPVEALFNDGNRVAVDGGRVAVAGSGAARVGRGGLATAAAGARTTTWTGREAKRIEIGRRSLAEAFADSHIVTITGRSPDGALTTQFAGAVHWSRARPDAQAILVDLVPFGSPVGFRESPGATFEREGDTVRLILAFTPMASGPGILSIA